MSALLARRAWLALLATSVSLACAVPPRFEFLDASNLPSRDAGHMDRCVMHFLDEDHFSSQWTWYQQGRESWMEEIICERVRLPDTPTAAAPATTFR